MASQLSGPELALKYSIYDWSSYSANYHPKNILVDNPSDQSSRWSSDGNHPPQFITLKLAQPSIVTKIVFGKYEKTHVCNLTKFKVYGGLKDDNMIELLSGGLNNDNVKEVLHMKHEIDRHQLPCNFIKIVPILSWNPSFNFSIWHIALHGIDDVTVLEPCLAEYNTYREREAIRLCLKHFRQKNYSEVFESLQKRTKVELEHPVLTQLHAAVVRCGDFERADRLMCDAFHSGMFDEFVHEQEYQPKWMPIVPLNEDGETSTCRPGMRGGHQMCIDTETSQIYMLGGWDGMQDLADFWTFNTASMQWKCISPNTAEDGGPCGRSCHKICLNTHDRCLYTLGRYLDSEARINADFKCDFFKYDLDSGQWTQISSDTASDGGPRLIFDHQMIYDKNTNKIFVFGGRILSWASTEEDRPFDAAFSGLYSYNLTNNTWSKLRGDQTISQCNDKLRSRIGHSMLFHPSRRLLFIFAGQRGKEFLDDFLTLNIDTGDISSITEKSDTKPVPAAGFAHRSTIDPDLDEIYVLSGLSKDKDKREDTVGNIFWVYNIKQGKWSCIYRNENQSQAYWMRMKQQEPCPRFAHQLVYDQLNKVHYLFGGNPGKGFLPKIRLDDFWQLKLERPTTDALLRRCRYLIKKHQYKELAVRAPCEAVAFLQTKVAELVDLGNDEERLEFQSLTSTLFGNPSSSNKSISITTFPQGTHDETTFHTSRTQLYEDLTAFFPAKMTQPKGNLVDLLGF